MQKVKVMVDIHWEIDLTNKKKFLPTYHHDLEPLPLWQIRYVFLEIFKQFLFVFEGLECYRKYCGNLIPVITFLITYFKVLRPKGLVGYAFMVCIPTENQNQVSFFLSELTLDICATIFFLWESFITSKMQHFYMYYVSDGGVWEGAEAGRVWETTCWATRGGERSNYGHYQTEDGGEEETRGSGEQITVR